MTTERITVLGIEDDPGDAELLRRALEQIPKFDITFECAGSSSAAKELLAKNAVDVVFLDYMLGAETGLAILEELRASGDIRPVIALTGQGDEYVARALLRWGADDYLAKCELSPEVLRRSIDNAMNQYQRRRLELINAQLVEDLKAGNEELARNNRRLAELYHTAHEFVDNVSHEFRTPLTVIKEFTSILNDGLVGDLTGEQKEYLETVLERVDDLSTMIDDMLDISKLEAGLLGIARRVCTVDEILDRVRTLFERKAAANKVRFTIEAEEGLPALYCDPEKVGRVLINLAINAFKYSGDGSVVAVRIQSDRDDGTVRFSVIDNGPGIDWENRAELFERFKQLDGGVHSGLKGFGLGLNIARELVHLAFGDIDVSGEAGAGSTFSFTVPVNEPTKLIRRYLDRIGSFREGVSHVSLVIACIGVGDSEAPADDVERFLQHQIRKCDLVFRRADREWLIVAAGSQQDLANFIPRIARSRQEANRNRPGRLLPELTMNVVGTWALPGERNSFTSALQDQLSAKELAHAH